jgi:futalosine hydrolase
MIVIVSATFSEIKNLISTYKNHTFVDFLITGMGVVNTMFAMQNYILNKKNFLENVFFINAGIAGAFDNAELLEICLGDTEIFSDFGVCFSQKTEYFKTPEKVTISNRFNDYINKNFTFDKTGTFLTVNCVTASPERKNFFQKKFNPLLENMEGYAAAFLAEKFNLNFSEIRVISNTVGDRENWQTERAVAELNSFLMKIIKKVEKNDFKI